jgi:hypothetical protein
MRIPLAALLERFFNANSDPDACTVAVYRVNRRSREHPPPCRVGMVDRRNWRVQARQPGTGLGAGFRSSLREQLPHVRATRRDACLGAGPDRANAGFSPERAKRHPRVCDVMEIEPFGKPAVWMYQFWQ